MICGIKIALRYMKRHQDFLSLTVVKPGFELSIQRLPANCVKGLEGWL